MWFLVLSGQRTAVLRAFLPWRPVFVLRTEEQRKPTQHGERCHFQNFPSHFYNTHGVEEAASAVVETPGSGLLSSDEL